MLGIAMAPASAGRMPFAFTGFAARISDRTLERSTGRKQQYVKKFLAGVEEGFCQNSITSLKFYAG